jgi:hypothetical protein
VYAVVNHLHFSQPIDPVLFAGAKKDLLPRMQAIEGCDAFHAIRTSEKDAFLVILGDNAEVLDRVATEVGSPWMHADVLPLLAGPPDRHIGPIITSTQYL